MMKYFKELYNNFITPPPKKITQPVYMFGHQFDSFEEANLWLKNLSLEEKEILTKKVLLAFAPLAIQMGWEDKKSVLKRSKRIVKELKRKKA